MKRSLAANNYVNLALYSYEVYTSETGTIMSHNAAVQQDLCNPNMLKTYQGKKTKNSDTLKEPAFSEPSITHVGSTIAV